jgi:hypothetical protein
MRNMIRKIALILIPMVLVSAMALGIRITSASPEILKVGIIYPVGMVQGDPPGGMICGAELGALDINASGGINVGGTQYYIKLVYANEWAYDYEHPPYWNEAKAREEIRRLLNEEGCKFVIGGFRTEVTWPIIQEVVAFNDATNDVYVNSTGIYWPDNYTRNMMVQWANKIIGTEWRLEKEVKSPIDQPFSRKARIPPWIYPLADWDVNFDGKIDTKDVARVSKAFGTMPGSAGWDIEADVNYDGKIDTKDIAAIAKHFGQCYHPWPIPDP